MRHLSLDEAQGVSGAACSDIRLVISESGFNLSMTFGDAYDCVRSGFDWIAQQYNSYEAHYLGGTPYGMPHVG